VISLAIGASYFIMTVLAEQFKTLAAATFMLWLPNVACVVLGLLLFRKARFK